MNVSCLCLPTVDGRPTMEGRQQGALNCRDRRERGRWYTDFGCNLRNHSTKLRKPITRLLPSHRPDALPQKSKNGRFSSQAARQLVRPYLTPRNTQHAPTSKMSAAVMQQLEPYAREIGALAVIIALAAVYLAAQRESTLSRAVAVPVPGSWRAEWSARSRARPPA